MVSPSATHAGGRLGIQIPRNLALCGTQLDLFLGLVLRSCAHTRAEPLLTGLCPALEHGIAC